MMIKGYYTLLFFVIINFLALLGLLSSFGFSVYVTQIVALFVFLILAVLMIFLFSKRISLGWPFSIFYFSLNLMNAVYIFFFTKQALLVIYALSSVLGLILSIFFTDKRVKKDFSKIKKIKKPKIIIEDLKPSKKSSKRKSVKKKPKKKITKKKK